MNENPGVPHDALPLHVIPAWPHRMAVRTLFPSDAPLELEVGAGKGLFLASAAAARPQHNFIGLEIARKYAEHAAVRLARTGLPNVVMIEGDIRRFWLQADGLTDLAAVHIYFPDPWWKRRHKKRRVFDLEFLDHVARVLCPGGALHLATDVEEYFLKMIATVKARPGFEKQTEPAAADDGPEHITNFERKYRVEARPIYRASYRWAGASNHVTGAS